MNVNQSVATDHQKDQQTADLVPKLGSKLETAIHRLKLATSNKPAPESAITLKGALSEQPKTIMASGSVPSCVSLQKSKDLAKKPKFIPNAAVISKGPKLQPSVMTKAPLTVAQTSVSLLKTHTPREDQTKMYPVKVPTLPKAAQKSTNLSLAKQPTVTTTIKPAAASITKRIEEPEGSVVKRITNFFVKKPDPADIRTQLNLSDAITISKSGGAAGGLKHVENTEERVPPLVPPPHSTLKITNPRSILLDSLPKPTHSPTAAQNLSSSRNLLIHKTSIDFVGNKPEGHTGFSPSVAPLVPYADDDEEEDIEDEMALDEEDEEVEVEKGVVKTGVGPVEVSEAGDEAVSLKDEDFLDDLEILDSDYDEEESEEESIEAPDDTQAPQVTPDLDQPATQQPETVTEGTVANLNSIQENVSRVDKAMDALSQNLSHEASVEGTLKSTTSTVTEVFEKSSKT